MSSDYQITRLTEATPEAVNDINALMPQISSKPRHVTQENLQTTLDSPTQIYVATSDGRIIGIAQLVITELIARTKCWIEDVTVDEAHRGQGLAKALIDAAIAGAPANTHSINFTSENVRGEAHALYTKLGFEKRDASVFRLTL